jgi:DNA-directed RNA polymerase specialized sigma24 family protein
MPFIEALDMDRLASEPRSSKPEAAKVVALRLRDCGSLEAAQEALASMLWPSGDVAVMSPIGKRALRLAARTCGINNAYDMIMTGYMDTAANWAQVDNAEAYLMRCVRNRAIKYVESQAREDITTDVALVSDTETTDAMRQSNRPVSDLARQSLNLAMDSARGIEQKILRLCMATAWDDTPIWPTIDAIASEIGITPAKVTAHMKALGQRMGVWTSDRVWRPIGAGPRRSGDWLRRQIASEIWSVVGLQWMGDGSGLVRYFQPNGFGLDEWLDMQAPLMHAWPMDLGGMKHEGQ